jgi:hypothetical protein
LTLLGLPGWPNHCGQAFTSTEFDRSRGLYVVNSGTTPWWLLAVFNLNFWHKSNWLLRASHHQHYLT